MKMYWKMMLTVVWVILITQNGIAANREEPLNVRDYANIISTENEEEIRRYAIKLNTLTAANLYVTTFESIDSGEAIKGVEEVINNKNSILIIYYSKEKNLEIKAGEETKEVITSELIEQIKKNEKINMLLSDDVSSAMVYISAITADQLLVEKGYLGTLEKGEADGKNRFSNIVFYIFVGILVVVVLFLTPISPYQKRRKNASSIYVPPNPYGGGFYGGGHTLGGDFTEDKSKKR